MKVYEMSPWLKCRIFSKTTRETKAWNHYWKKLKSEDPKYTHDYNLIEYAKEHSMAIITKDGELRETCKGNNFLLKLNFWF